MSQIKTKMKLPTFPSAKISLYEFTLTLGLFLLAIAQENIFIFILLIGLISRQLLSLLVRLVYVNKRPNDAVNCDITNSGGIAKDQLGFPSGHTMFATFLFIYTLYESIRIHKEQGVLLWLPLLVTGSFFVLMPIARVHIKCHTISQVLGGILFGTIWTLLFILFEQYILVKWPRYVTDKNRFIQSFIIKRN
jgi:membrane-associated phospholipid phosphatase